MATAATEIEVVNGTDPWSVAITIATFLAVVAALFGPIFVEWMRRPRVGIVTGGFDRAAWIAGQAGEVGGPQLFVGITNDGRRQANDVQVFLTMAQPGQTTKPGAHINAYQTPVAFVHQEGGRWTRQHSVAIPQGFTRPLHLLTVSREMRFVLANVSDAYKWPLRAPEYAVALDIVGSNFKVARYVGRLTFTGLAPDGTAVRGSQVQWSKSPRRLTYETGNPLRSA